jgi:hypothetical protein
MAAYKRISDNEEQQNLQRVCRDELLQWVPVYFKVISDFHDVMGTIHYNIPLFWSVTRMKYEIHHWIMSDIHFPYSNYTAVFIETGQETEEGVLPEDGKMLEGETISFAEKYTNQNKWPSFYIKLSHRSE